LKTRRVVVSRECIIGDCASLSGDLHHYLCHVLRLSRGARILLADGSGDQYEGRISRISGQELTITLTRHVPAPPGPRPRLALIYGLSRRTRTELVLQKATELGIDWLIPCLCKRSVSRPRQPEQKLERWHEILRHATQQCSRTAVPLLSPVHSFKSSLEAVQNSEMRLMAHPGGAPLQRFSDALQSARDSIALMVGPEGGLSQQEARHAKFKGFVPVSLGPTILRTETAAITMVALVAFLCGRLGAKG
jgi:16S rRNA (uracil1498-N3)-methyltransferase